VALFAPIVLYGALLSGPQDYNVLQHTVLMNIPFAVAALLAWSHAGKTQDRLAWRLIATGVGAYLLGNVIADAQRYGGLPSPWWLDEVVTILMPLCMYVAVTLIVRARVDVWQPSTALDGLIIATGGAALLYRTLYAPLIDAAAEKSQGGGHNIQAIIFAAYPIADLMMVAMAVSALFLLRPGWRSPWLPLVLSFTTFMVTDLAHLHDAMDHVYAAHGWREVGWMIGGALIGVAARSRWSGRGVENYDASSVIFWPVAIGFVMVSYLAGNIRHEELQTDANLIGLLSLALVVTRTCLTIREVHKLFATRRESRSDEVTGLGNRRRFDEKLAEAVKRRQPFAVLMMDLDGFKQVNDGFGHEIGDRVLVEVAQRIESVTPENSVCTRIGGDEFALIVPVRDERRMREIAESLLASVQQPYLFDVKTCQSGDVIDAEHAHGRDDLEITQINATIGASIGCSLYPRDGAETQLVRFADSAMYRIKKSGGGVLVHEASTGANETGMTQFQLLRALRSALHSDDPANCITVHYQPLKPSRDEDMMVVEALARWQHADQLISPGVFIPLAESGGLMQKMTERVLDRALADIAALRAEGEEIAVSVNLAVSSLLDPTLLDRVKHTLARHKVPAQALKLEITESMILLDPKMAQRTVRSLRELGIGVMIDDYGTGYSSIAHLQQLDITGLKIDRSFVTDIATDSRALLIVKSVMDMARAMNLQVVAEGVENRPQLDTLASMGCHYIQGFLIAKPMPLANLREWLASASETSLAA
jgi:diguanylate cyclase (GGDEF)-like protein